MSLKLTSPKNELKEKFSSLTTNQDIANLLDIDLKTLIYYVYRQPESEQYIQFEIPKRLGGNRIIRAPISPIKILQQKLNQVLQSVYKIKPPVHGFVEGRGVKTNAHPHTAKDLILNIDLKDFFPSIHFGRLFGMFNNPPYSLNTDVAKTLANLCCYETVLPQGAPTSPIISNMICEKLDRQLSRIARDYDCDYSRYADDITFSTNAAMFPKSLVTKTEEGIIELG